LSVERWRGTVNVTPYDRREMVVTDDKLIVVDPTEAKPPIELDLLELAEHGVLLPHGTTMTVVDRSAPDPEATRLQLRAFVPSTFDDIDWPPRVRELVEAQVARAEAARLELRRQLTGLVAWTITGLGVLLVVLVVVLLLA
jgi:hypothetical protein